MAVSLSSVDLFRAFCSGSQIPQGDQIGALRERVAQLEASKTSLTVDSVLARLRSIVAKTGRNFSKEEAFDCLIDLRAAGTTEQHERLLHFQAVYEAMKYKISFPPDQFRRYLVALLGDKAQEKVYEILGKVDKSFKLHGELASKSDAVDRPPPSRHPSAYRQLRCFYCGALGHM